MIFIMTKVVKAMVIRNYDDTPLSPAYPKGTSRHLPLQVRLIRRTSVTVVRRISSPCKGEMPAKQAERVLLERVYKVFNYEYKEKNHEKNNSGAGVGGVTECV